MPPLTLVFLGMAALGIALVAAGLAWMRLIGADRATARRLAGARQMTIADVLDLPARSAPVRIEGRIRCADPLFAPDDERLVAFHRDVQVRTPDGTWRTVERLRETRSFELWDHTGALELDPAEAREPLIAIPQVWVGPVSELQEPHASAAGRLAQQYGPATRARSITRTISVVDRLLVLASIVRGPEGRPRLAPPPGGYVVSAVELEAAMRLLGGPRRRQLAAAIVLLIAGAAAAAGGLLAAGVAGIAGV
jgi:hypothetical protein